VSAVPDVTVRTLDCTMDCLVVVASDGVWDVMTSDEAVEIAGRAIAEVQGESEAERGEEPSLPSWAIPGPKPQGDQDAAQSRRAALAIVREALERGSADNITAVVHTLDWARQRAE
jgi:serine/threonine protein phosphatase PrpC